MRLSIWTTSISLWGLATSKRSWSHKNQRVFATMARTGSFRSRSPSLLVITISQRMRKTRLLFLSPGLNQAISNWPTRSQITSMIWSSKTTSTLKATPSGSFLEWRTPKRAKKSSSTCLTWSSPRVSTTRVWKSLSILNRSKNKPLPFHLPLRRKTSAKRVGIGEARISPTTRTTTERTSPNKRTTRDATTLLRSPTHSRTTMIKCTLLTPSLTLIQIWPKIFVKFSRSS